MKASQYVMNYIYSISGLKCNKNEGGGEKETKDRKLGTCSLSQAGELPVQYSSPLFIQIQTPTVPGKSSEISGYMKFYSCNL